MTETGTANLAVVQGDTFSKVLSFSQSAVPLDVSSFDFAATAVAFLGDPADPPLVDFTITLGPASNQLTLSLLDEETLLLPAREYWWNLEWVNGSERQTILEGVFTVKPQSGAHA